MYKSTSFLKISSSTRLSSVSLYVPRGWLTALVWTPRATCIWEFRFFSFKRKVMCCVLCYINSQWNPRQLFILHCVNISAAQQHRSPGGINSFSSVEFTFRGHIYRRRFGFFRMSWTLALQTRASVQRPLTSPGSAVHRVSWHLGVRAGLHPLVTPWENAGLPYLDQWCLTWTGEVDGVGSRLFLFISFMLGFLLPCILKSGDSTFKKYHSYLSVQI